MQRTWACLVLAAACGDDGAAGADGDAGSSSSSSGALDDSSSGPGSVSADTTEGDDSTSDGGDTTTSAGSSSGAADTTGAASSSGDESSSSGGMAEECLAPEVFAAIDQHAHDLDATAGLLAGHPSSNEVTGFMLAPGLPEPPALPSSFAGPLIMMCSDPLVYDEFCEEGRCMQIECTGEGSAWINHVWIEPAIDGDPWSFDEVHLHLHWSGGTGTSIDITTTSIGPGGVDMSLTGEGEMDVDSMTVTETFAALHPAGITVFEYANDAVGYSGQLTIADVIVAEVDDAGHLAWTGDCP